MDICMPFDASHEWGGRGGGGNCCEMMIMVVLCALTIICAKHIESCTQHLYAIESK